MDCFHPEKTLKSNTHLHKLSFLIIVIFIVPSFQYLEITSHRCCIIYECKVLITQLCPTDTTE